VGGGEYSICYDENHGRPPYESGGPLFIIKKSLVRLVDGYVNLVGAHLNPPQQNIGAMKATDDWRDTYSGGVSLSRDFTTPGIGDLPLETRSILGPEDYDGHVNPNDLSSLGNRAWAKLRPKIEKAGLAQAVIESREIPSMLKQSAKGFSQAWEGLRLAKDAKFGAKAEARRRIREYAEATPKRLADQFLNATFGWTPFIKDLSDMADLISNFRQYADEAAAKNGEWRRRVFREEPVESDVLLYSTTGVGSVGISPSFTGGVHVVPSTSTLQIRRQKMSRVWYEGSFKAYRPEFDPARSTGYPAIDDLRKAISLSGARLDATTIYKVTPWTWAVDWFVNAGDFVRRVEDLATDSVVARYFYLMRETYYRYEFISTFSTYDGGPHTVRGYRSVHVQRRDSSANPFNFSLLPGGLSGKQAAILAALGISKWG
jgi:hypothetical protein